MGDASATVTAIARLFWVRNPHDHPSPPQSAAMKYGVTLVVDPSATFWWLAEIGEVLSQGYKEAPDLSTVTFRRSFAVDNYYHYGL